MRTCKKACGFPWETNTFFFALFCHFWGDEKCNLCRPFCGHDFMLCIHACLEQRILPTDKWAYCCNKLLTVALNCWHGVQVTENNYYCCFQQHQWYTNSGNIQLRYISMCKQNYRSHEGIMFEWHMIMWLDYTFWVQNVTISSCYPSKYYSCGAMLWYQQWQWWYM